MGVCTGYIGPWAVLVNFGMLGCACVNLGVGAGFGGFWYGFSLCVNWVGGEVNLVNSGILGCVCVIWVGCGRRAWRGWGGGDFFLGNLSIMV